MLPLPAAGGACLFLGAEPGFRLPEGFDCELSLVQGFRPDFLALQRAGHRSRRQCRRRWLRGGAGPVRPPSRPERACASPRPSNASADGGLVVVAGGKEDGIASLRQARWASSSRSTGRRRSIMAWPSGFACAGDRRGRRRGNSGGCNPPALIDGRFETAPGMFSHERIDPGSQAAGRSAAGGSVGQGRRLLRRLGLSVRRC